MNASNPSRVDGCRPPIMRLRSVVRSSRAPAAAWVASMLLAACAASPGAHDDQGAHDASAHDGDHRMHAAGTAQRTGPTPWSALDPQAPVPPVRHAETPRHSGLVDGSPVNDWRAVNDRVRDIGGWRNYMREQAHGAAQPAGDQPAGPVDAQRPSTPAAAPAHEHHHHPAERSTR